MVAMGVTAQLLMEGEVDEAKRVASFFARVGLPITLEQIGLSVRETANVDAVVEGARSFEPFANLPFVVTPEKIRAAMLAGDDLGRAVVADVGDESYRRLHA
jgi:glycerol dehydrogenase